MANVFRDEEGRLPLEDAKRLVLKNLRILELAGMTSSKDGCQSILTSLAKDIIHQRDHRVRRKAEGRVLFRSAWWGKECGRGADRTES